jgi:PEP-CTERM motif-containing protein
VCGFVVGPISRNIDPGNRVVQIQLIVRNRMRLKSALMGISVTLALAVFAPTIARADLLGSEVTSVLLFPTLTSFCNKPGVCSGPIGPVPVTSGVPPEFPAGTVAFDGSLAVSGSQIIWTATLAETYAAGVASPGAGAFNGLALMFTGAPTITNVTLDSASTILPVPFVGPPVSSSSGFSFNGNNVLFNLAGDSVAAGQQLILDVQTSPSAVPEPASLGLLGAGLLGGAALLRRKFMPL